MYYKPGDRLILRCEHYMVIFGLGILAKHCRVGQGKPGFPHFADASQTVYLKLQKLQMHENGNSSVGKAVVKCLRVEEKSFVARNGMKGSRSLLQYDIYHINCFPLYNFFFDARLGDIQETDSRTL